MTDKHRDELPRFIVDVMLGRLARWMRLAGLNTLYSNTWEDALILARALSDRRTIITRDRGLIQQARRASVPAFDPSADDYRTQILDLLGAFHLDPGQLPWFQRCPSCNSTLSAIVRSPKLALILPEYIYQTHEHYLFCPNCIQYFWPGSHVAHIQRFRHWLIDHYEVKEEPV